MSLPIDFVQRPIAHRALHDTLKGRAENSVKAVQAAVTHGYGVEIDVQLSADGQAMAFHDDRLDRMTTQTGPIGARVADDLTTIALRDGDGDCIPTLATILDVVSGRVPVLIELKDQSRVMGPGPDVLERAVARALAGYQGPVAVMSFNPFAIRAFGSVAPDVARGLITSAYAEPAWALLGADRLAELKALVDVDRIGAQFISHEASNLANPAVANLKRRGLPILCWTVRSVEAEMQARRVADNVTFEGYLA